MFSFKNTFLDSLALHRVGNKNRAESNFESAELYNFGEALGSSLQQFFQKPFKKSAEQHHFTHSTDINHNEVYIYAKAIFDNPDCLHEQSVNILYHLYKQSNHSNIKSGELFIAFFRDVMWEDELINAIGIFKSENKYSFLEISRDERNLELKRHDGLSLEKMDKGCMIFNTEAAEGYRVLTVDNNRYDANYWPRYFLNIDNVKDEVFHTKSYLQLCDDFAKDVIAPQANTQEQMKFLTDSVEYFNNNENFVFDDFTKEVETLKPFQEEFRNYQADYNLQDVKYFPISPTALKTASRKFDHLIKLDTNIQIKLDLNDPDASREFLEKGYDEEKGMHYYKVYFNEEVKE
ncbi:MAG TPA: nucleoid-associated protein [Saprospiraceae bacterium]|nr:nucleoid-associated protein [Saprospiraceae bacterium]